MSDEASQETLLGGFESDISLKTKNDAEGKYLHRLVRIEAYPQLFIILKRQAADLQVLAIIEIGDLSF